MRAGPVRPLNQLTIIPAENKEDQQLHTRAHTHRHPLALLVDIKAIAIALKTYSSGKFSFVSVGVRSFQLARLQFQRNYAVYYHMSVDVGEPNAYLRKPLIKSSLIYEKNTLTQAAAAAAILPLAIIIHGPLSFVYV